MKKNILALLSACISIVTVKAATDTVHVANYQFTPATINVVVGDTVVWVWDEGNHTTTCDPSDPDIPGTSLPAGAEPWNSLIDESNSTFQYVITVEGTYNYICIPHYPNMVGSIIATGALPVQLANFTIVPTANNKALISWNTLTEQNTSYFSVRRSSEGTNFTEITKIDAIGNSTTIQEYSYTDNNVGTTDKYLYYSLEIVDKDGRRTLSEIKMFKNTLAQIKLITKLSPNPISSPGHLMVQFNADKSGSMLVELYDVNGKFIKQTEMAAVQGLNSGHFHLGNLPAGVYNLVFTFEGIKETRSIIMQ